MGDRERLEELRRLQGDLPQTERDRLTQLREEQSGNAFTSLGYEVTDDGRLRRSLTEAGTTNPLDAIRQLKRGADENIQSGLANALSLIPAGFAGIAGLVQGDVEQKMNRLGLSESRATPIERAGERMESTQEFITRPFAPETQSGLAIQDRVSDVMGRIDTAVTDFFDVGQDVERKAERLNVPDQMLDPLRPLFPALSTSARVAGETGVGVGTGMIANRSLRALRNRGGPTEPTPTIRRLFSDARQAFNAARLEGGGIRPEVLQGFATRLRNLRNEQGLRIDFDPDLHGPAHRAWERMVDDFENGNLNFDELMTLREIASELSQDQVGRISFRGRRLRNEIDDFIDNLEPDDVVSGDPVAAAQNLNRARALWRDASAARTIEQQINLAGIDAGDFTGAGFENKLRIRFRQLARSIEQGRERGFTPDEVALINRVARGGTVDNIFRMVGKAAPTGIVSGGIGAGVGFQMGGPVGAVAVPAVGLAGRELATRATIRNANRALEAPLRRSLLDSTQ